MMRETYSVGVAALRPTRARAAVMLGSCIVIEVVECLFDVLRRSVDEDLPIYEGQRDLMYSSGIISKHYTLTCALTSSLT